MTERPRPARGDPIRLADTDLRIRVGEDRQARGDEPIWGYGKTLRSRMAQDDAAGPSQLDLVVCGAVVVDPSIGVVRADIGVKDGRIVGVGRAGNPAITEEVDLVIGPHTEPIMAYGLIATPGAIDSHVHLITPRLLPAALSAGVTTLVTAGFDEPPYAMERTLRSLEEWPLNVGLQANARAQDPGGLERLLDAGAVGFKVHEDYGAYPELIDAVLAFADAHDVSVALHTDGLNESGELEETLAAIGGRTVHAYHVEGAGGGHVPDLIGIVREPNVICSSTTPTIPYGRATAEEHLPMILLNHGGRRDDPHDVELARERIHPATMAAEGPLHELGAIAVMNSDSQGMGRMMETVRRTVQLADVMKRWRAGPAAEGIAGPSTGSEGPGASRTSDASGASDAWDASDDDNERVLRYLAKVTIEPALTHGLADHVGSLRPGRLADIVLWRPAFFGAKPELVFKAGYPAWGVLGEGNATVEGAEPTRYGAHWGSGSGAGAAVSVTFVSASVDPTAFARRLGSSRAHLPVRRTRRLTRADLLWNRSVVPVEVDPTDGTVTLGGRILAADPVDRVPLTRRYWLR